MYTIIPPSQFTSVPWKNGKGKTVELAINSGGTLENFDWRLSIASVVEDGAFSDFSDYHRNLVLIKGCGITLNHSDKEPDHLDSILSVASFDGSNLTTGHLTDGAITDFNIITSKQKYHPSVTTYSSKSSVEFCNKHLNFCYSLTEQLLVSLRGERFVVEQGCLLMIEMNSDINGNIEGNGFIFIQLEKLKVAGEG